MEKKNKKKALLAASVAGLMAVSGAAFLGTGQAHAAEGQEKCYGINACKGTGACGGKGHSCAGKNGCEGQAWLYLPEGTCTKIKGGSLTPVEG